MFGWVLEQLARKGLIKGKTIGVDSTTLEANAAMKSIVRRDTQEGYSDYLRRLAEAAEGEATDAAGLVRMDRKRAKTIGDSDEGEQQFRDDVEHAIRDEIEHVRSVATLALRLSEKCSASSSVDIRSVAEVGSHWRG